MPLNEYIDETMHILKNSPDATEIIVERAKQMRLAESYGEFEAFFKSFNEGFIGDMETE